MGALLKEKCYPSQAEAVDAFFSGKDPSYTAGATSYLSWFEKNGSTWQIKRQSIDSGGAVTNLTTSNATSPVFPTCDEVATFNDGLTVGWGIATAMVLAWGYSMIRKQAR